MAKKLAPEVLAHLEWLGFVQPTGLVVSPMALSRLGVIIQRNDKASQDRLLELIPAETFEPGSETVPHLPDFEAFTRTVLGWKWTPKYYAGTSENPIPDELRHRLEDYEETLAPDFAVSDRDPDEGACAWQLLVRVLSQSQGFDEPVREGGTYEASPHARLERLLRATGAPAGLLFNGHILRLVSAPRGESSGWIDFRVGDMVQTAGRLVCAALVLLLSQNRLLTVSSDKRLPALLAESRKYQNTVSEQLAEQVLHALYELLRGLESADARANGDLLRGIRRDDPDQVYHALLNILLRMVFLLYAEERGMLPKDEAFLRHYSLVGLHRRLTEDAALYPDTMDQRFGAWAQLIVLFRMVHDGAESGALQIPARHGVLFDPDRYPFLEGRTGAGVRQVGGRLDYPRIPDGTIQRVLEKLLVLEGERLSYRALDVEQIGSVYETMMGFRIEAAAGTSIAIKAQKRGGAPTTIDLDALLEVEGRKRAKWVQENADRKLSKTVADSLKAATTIEELHAALDKVLDKAATPDLVPKGSLVLQPSEARRKSGSHYTPRELTEPIVQTTLRPILERLRKEAGGPLTPDQILDLKVCDPAMGSGAFLVEACRQLGDALIESWGAHEARPQIPGDEDEVIHARRLVAQRCLYGVDRNPVAVNLAKVSLWLTTLAKDHAFTFVDHALRHGDSLVGLTNTQIAARDWSNEEPVDSPKYRQLKAKVDEVVALRRQIREAGDETGDWELRDLLDEAEHKMSEVRTWGDLVIEAFFSVGKDKARKQALGEVAKQIAAGLDSGERARLDGLRREDPPLAPFHWGVEFPEVFDRELTGFDAFVGNPPFMGGHLISGAQGVPYFSWLTSNYPPAAHYCDLVAYFFRRVFDLLRVQGTAGLIATNSIAVGDTRNGGLLPIRKSGGSIYFGTRNMPWPGRATVIVSRVHFIKAIERPENAVLDGKRVDQITAFLMHMGPDDDPVRLGGLGETFSAGSQVYGQGFLFDDKDEKANPLSLREELIQEDPSLESRLPRYIGGSELLNSPTHSAHRYVIYLSDCSSESDVNGFPSLARIVREKVKPERDALKDTPVNRPLKKKWWAYQAHRPKFYDAIKGRHRVIAISKVTTHLLFAFLPTGMVYSQKLIVFDLDSLAAIAALHSRVHEEWVRFCGGVRGAGFSYTPSDCFETFPFPVEWQTSPALEAAGQAYYDFRAALMVETDLGLTKTYNRFHDPEEDDPKIVRLRELHTDMDRAVLDAYGWTDISTDCEFLLDYEGEDDDGSSRRKKPWRYRWPDEVRDEVLARLLELNAQRAKEEAEGAAPAGELFA